MRYTVIVEVRHIRCGTPGEAGGCPIALKLREVFPDEEVRVFGEVAMVGGAAYQLPLKCAEFSARFDNGRAVSPFTFVLDTTYPLSGWKWQ